MRIFGFEITRVRKKTEKTRSWPPPPPPPVRWTKESDRSFKKRQDAYILDRAREQL